MPIPKILPGDHETLADSQKRSHYQKGCRHPDCVNAASAYRLSRKKAADPKPDGYVDHFAEASTEVAATGIEPKDVPAAAAAVVSLAAAQPAPEPVTPTPSKPRVPASGIASRGASRRLQALIHMGYTRKELATAVNVEVDSIWKLLIAPPKTIPTDLHRRIVEQFKTLRLSPKTTKDGTPEHVAAQWSRSLAAQLGWAGPFDWDDIDTHEKPSHTGHEHSKDAAAEHKQAAAFFLAETGLDIDAAPDAASASLQVVIDRQQQEILVYGDRLAHAQARAEQEAQNAATALETVEAAGTALREMKVELTDASTELAHTKAQLAQALAVVEAAEYDQKGNPDVDQGGGESSGAAPEARVLQDYVDRIILTVDGPVLTLELPIPGRR